ncbi:MAG: BLUF domain-containing protein [Opitutales bacterium]|nr:BLUF domain-containing protein [Opitutales bacterium]
MKECRLIYKSLSTDEIVSNETLQEIIEKGSKNNSEKDISGLLLLTGNQFLQVLEGPLEEVNQLYLKICKDTRHHHVNLLNFELIAERYFETWNMRLVDLWDLPGTQREFLLSKYKSKDEVIEIPDNFLEIYSLLLDAKSFCTSTPWK